MAKIKIEKLIALFRKYGYGVAEHFDLTLGQPCTDPTRFSVTGVGVLQIWNRYLPIGYDTEIAGHFSNGNIIPNGPGDLGSMFVFKTREEADVEFKKFQAGLRGNGIKAIYTHDKKEKSDALYKDTGSESPGLILAEVSTGTLDSEGAENIINKLIEVLNVKEEEIEGIYAESTLL